MLSRRKMEALCASLLFCLLLSLGAGWAQSQLTIADQLAADTLRLHIRADTNSARDQSAKLAVRDAVLALITINLGIFNLLPFPALDGGKVVFLIVEGVTGRAVPEKLQSALTIAAFGLLFGLMIFATYNDIIRLVTGTM